MKARPYIVAAPDVGAVFIRGNNSFVLTGGLIEVRGGKGWGGAPCWRGGLRRCHTPTCVSVCVSARQPVFDAAVQHPHINTTQRL